MNKRPLNIVIAGAGFGGLYFYRFFRRLHKEGDIKITIIDRNNYFLFTPLLHEVATASIGEKQAVESINLLLKTQNDDFLVDEVVNINPVNKVVKTKMSTINYDFLVLALGSTSKRLNLNGLHLKNISDAVSIKKQIISSFEKASCEKDVIKRQNLLKFVVVGGGPTGVELAAEISELVTQLVQLFNNKILLEDVKLICIQGAPRLLPNFSEKLGIWAFDILKKKGWKVIVNAHIKESRGDSIILENDNIIESNNIFWTIGVVPNTSFVESLQSDKNGRIEVNEFLQVDKYKEIYAIGDNAVGTNNSYWPMLAQAAVQNAKIAAKNLSRTLRNRKLLRFVYHSRGSLISVGRWQAIGEIGGFAIRGPFVWVLWQFVYLFKFFSWRKRFQITLDWISHVFGPRDISSINK